MSSRFIANLAALTALALFIWMRDLTWISNDEDTLPILVALPLFMWFGQPWELSEKPTKPMPRGEGIAIIALFLVGIVADTTLLLAIGWTWLLWSILRRYTPVSRHTDIKKLLVLPLLAFPWITLDMNSLGWWFRLTGAWVTAHIYSLLGFDVIHSGTNLIIDNLPISVEAACSGLNTLQSMLIVGSVVAFISLGHSNRYWGSFFILFAMAWLANTIRICALSGAALAFGHEFAMGPFHTWGGWLILVFMFVCCWAIFHAQERALENSNKAHR